MSDESMKKQLIEEADHIFTVLTEKYSMEQQNEIINNVYNKLLNSRRADADKLHVEIKCINTSIENLVNSFVNSR